MVDLRKLDIRQPVPESLHWASSFDLIHQRLLIWGLKTHEWVQVVDNLRGILKPGGWIQLVEVQWVDRDAPFDPIKFPRLAKMSELQIWGSEASGMNIHIAYELEQLLQDLGFQHITKTSFKVGYGAKARDESWRLPSVEMWGEVFRPFAHRIPPEGIPGLAKTPAELDLFLDELKADVLEYGYEPQINFVIGQKPLN